MAISLALAILVWFIDSFDIRKTKKLEKELDETKNRIEEVEESQKWEVL